MVEVVPMPTVAEKWAAQFKLRIITRLTKGPTQWTRDEAIKAAQAEWEAVSEATGEDANWSVEEDPAAAADECLSYWDDDGE